MEAPEMEMASTPPYKGLNAYRWPAADHVDAVSVMNDQWTREWIGVECASSLDSLTAAQCKQVCSSAVTLADTLRQDRSWRGLVHAWCCQQLWK